MNASCSYANAVLIINRTIRRFCITHISSPGDRGGPAMFARIGVMRFQPHVAEVAAITTVGGIIVMI